MHRFHQISRRGAPKPPGLEPALIGWDPGPMAVRLNRAFLPVQPLLARSGAPLAPPDSESGRATCPRQAGRHPSQPGPPAPPDLPTPDKTAPGLARTQLRECRDAGTALVEFNFLIGALPPRPPPPCASALMTPLLFLLVPLG